VFCGSSPGKKSSYQDAAIELGNELVRCLFMSLFSLHYASVLFSSTSSKPFLSSIFLMGVKYFSSE